MKRKPYSSFSAWLFSPPARKPSGSSSKAPTHSAPSLCRSWLRPSRPSILTPPSTSRPKARPPASPPSSTGLRRSECPAAGPSPPKSEPPPAKASYEAHHSRLRWVTPAGLFCVCRCARPIPATLTGSTSPTPEESAAQDGAKSSYRHCENSYPIEPHS